MRNANGSGDDVEFVWKPSPLWDGRRWELVRVGGGISLYVGRVAKFCDGRVESTLTEPKWKQLKGSFSTLRDAGDRLVHEVKKIRFEERRRKR